MPTWLGQLPMGAGGDLPKEPFFKNQNVPLPSIESVCAFLLGGSDRERRSHPWAGLSFTPHLPLPVPHGAVSTVRSEAAPMVTVTLLHQEILSGCVWVEILCTLAPASQRTASPVTTTPQAVQRAQLQVQGMCLHQDTPAASRTQG